MHGLGAGSVYFAGMLPSCCGFFLCRCVGARPTHPRGYREGRSTKFSWGTSPSRQDTATVGELAPGVHK